MTLGVPDKNGHIPAGGEAISPRPSALAAAIAIGATALTLASISFPWITAGVGSNAATYSGLQLPPAAIPISIAALLTAVLTVGSVWGSAKLAPFAVLASGIAAFITAAIIMVTEVAALLVPASLLPDTIRRQTFALGAGFGIWLALAGSAVAAIALWGRLPHSIAQRAHFSRAEWRRILAMLGLVTLTVLIGWLRYRTWIDASLLERHIGLPAWAAPWIGPLSLMAVWMLVGALLLVALYSTTLGGLVAAAAGWLTSLLAALVVLAVSSIGKLGLDGLVSGGAERYAPGFHTTGFVWASFLAGLTAAGVGAILVHFPDRPGT